MKKSVFCVLFALLISLLTVAVAENAKCCACCSATGSTADSASTAYIPKYDDADYTLEVVYDGFHLFLPSSFEKTMESTEGVDGKLFQPVSGAQMPQILIGFSDQPIKPLTDTELLQLSHDELRERFEMLIANIPEYSVIQVDECLGVMRREQSNVSFTITNRKSTIYATVYFDLLDEALELAQGIIDHAVAKEIPLEELAQAE